MNRCSYIWRNVQHGDCIKKEHELPTAVTHAMTLRVYDALLFVGTMRLYRGKIFARWVYKTTNARNDTTRARNPRFYFVHARIAGTKPRFLTKMRHQKSGIPCSAHDDALLFVGTMRLYLCNIFARWVYKILTHAMTRRCVAFLVGTMRLYFVTYLQDGFTKY